MLADALDSTPGLEGLGTLAQGFLEISNVSIVNELVEIHRSAARYAGRGILRA